MTSVIVAHAIIVYDQIVIAIEIEVFVVCRLSTEGVLMIIVDAFIVAFTGIGGPDAARGTGCDATSTGLVIYTVGQ